MNQQDMSAVEYYVARDYIQSLKDFCLSRKLNIFEIMQNANIPIQELMSSAPYVNAATCLSFLNSIPQIADNPVSLAMQYGDWLASQNSHGCLGLAMRSTQNFYEAYKLFEKYGRLRTNLFQVSVVKEGGYIYVVSNFESSYQRDELDDADYLHLKVFSAIATIFNAYLFLKRSLGNIDIESKVELFVDFDIGRYEFDSAIKVHDNQEFNGLKIALDIGTSLFTSCDDEIYRDLNEVLAKELENLPRTKYSDKVQSIIKSLPLYDASVELIAIELNTSVSTLQRRLRDEGTSFKELKCKERISRAKECLLFTNKTLETIACDLGFSNASNFSKSFRSSIGDSPYEFRASARRRGMMLEY